MLEIITKWIERYSLLEQGDRVIAACSGGPDSVALVHILNQLREEYGIFLAVAHVNHMLRGRESDMDAEFVGELSNRLGIPFYQKNVDVKGLCAAEGLSTMEAARILRYDFLRHVAGMVGGAKIATGHHRDDQAETVLHHFLRGSGSCGLRGMRPVEDGVIRPLLAVKRLDIERYCQGNRLATRTDSSNLKTEYLRNRIRMELLPYLETNYNPNITEALWRISRITADEYAYIRGKALETGIISMNADGTVGIDKDQFRQLPAALQREVIRLALEKSREDVRGITFDHVEKLMEMVLSGRSGALMPLTGNIMAKNSYKQLEFGPITARKSRFAIASPGIELAVPGNTVIPGLNLMIRAELLADHYRPSGMGEAVFDWDILEPPIFVRTRAEGDRFQPMGMNGTKKLKDYFIDCKIPREKRDKAAIFSDREGIIWIGGYRQSDRGKISGNTKHFLRLSIIEQEEM